MTPTDIPLYITVAETIINFFRGMNVADGAVLLLIAAAFHPPTRQRLIAALGGANGNGQHYVTPEQLEERITAHQKDEEARWAALEHKVDEVGKEVATLTGSVNGINQRISDILGLRKQKSNQPPQ